MNTRLQRAWKFHLEHGGYATPPGRAVCAINAARAERLLERLEDSGRAKFEVLPDESPDMSWADARDLEIAERDGVWGVVLSFKCPKCGQWEVADSLWGIIFPPNYADAQNYTRTLRADLMLNARAEKRRVA